MVYYFGSVCHGKYTESIPEGTSRVTESNVYSRRTNFCYDWRVDGWTDRWIYLVDGRVDGSTGQTNQMVQIRTPARRTTIR